MHCRGLVDVYEMACFFVTLDGNVPVTMPHKFQQSIQMTVVVPRLQFIDRVGHCSYVTKTSILLVQAVQKTVKTLGAVIWRDGECPSLCNDRCRGSDSAVSVEVPLLQVIDSRRHPCCGGPDSNCGGAAEAVYRSSSISLLWHRGSMWKLCENCRRPQASFLASVRDEFTTQVMSSICLSDCCIAFTAVDIHTVEHVTKTTTTTIIQSGEAPF